MPIKGKKSKVKKKGKKAKERGERDRPKKLAAVARASSSDGAKPPPALARTAPASAASGGRPAAASAANGGRPAAAAQTTANRAAGSGGRRAAQLPPAAAVTADQHRGPQRMVLVAPAHKPTDDRSSNGPGTTPASVQAQEKQRMQQRKERSGDDERTEPLRAIRPSSARSAIQAPSRPGSSYAAPAALAAGSPSRGLDTIEHHFIRAAELLLNADYVLIAAGAGFSADSGLPVYKDIANVEAYKRMNVTYADLCTPDWLQRDPEVFFGFWGSCYNDYMETDPHRGYQICKDWNDTQFHATSAAMVQEGAAGSLGTRMQRLSIADAAGGRPPTREAGPPLGARAGLGSAAGRGGRQAGAGRAVPDKTSEMFIYTSNVDTAFRRAGFAAEQILEIHGNVCDWQCAKPERCREDTWRIPGSHRFAVDKKLMRAPRWKCAEAPAPTGAEVREGAAARSLPLLGGTCGLPEQQYNESEQAASARTTYRAQAPGGTGGGSFGGGGINAARGLASQRPPSASSTCSSSSSNLSGHECPSPLSLRACRRPPPPDALASSANHATPAVPFSLSAYPPRAGGSAAAPPLLPLSTQQQLVLQRGVSEATREVAREKVLNHIRCPGCGRAARPNVLMFDDDDWVR